MGNDFKNMKNVWDKAYKELEQNEQALSYPTETIVRLFKGDYLTGDSIDYKDKKIIDVGFGNGNNSLFFAEIGMQLFGVEIQEEICDILRKKLETRNLSGEIKVGSNQNLPFDENYFDFLVSWNVIHYEGEEKNIKNAIKEYARVIKKGGRVIISTTGPGHKILLKSKKVAPHLYEINRPNDPRVGQVHYFFENSEFLEQSFEPYFENIQAGRINDLLFREKLDWLLLTGIKK